MKSLTSYVKRTRPATAGMGEAARFYAMGLERTWSKHDRYSLSLSSIAAEALPKDGWRESHPFRPAATSELHLIANGSHPRGIENV
jgi:hypothetical protein